MASVIDRFQSTDGSIGLMLLEGQPAVELLQSNPLAGYCLALNHLFRKPSSLWPLAAARALMGKPQREILGWLGFHPATEAIAKIGRKCLPEALTIERALDLRRALANDHTRASLAHLRHINAGVIGLVSSQAMLSAVTPQLLHSTADRQEEHAADETAQLLRDTLRMRLLLRVREPVVPYRSRRRLIEDHDELVVQVNVRRFRSQPENRTAAPPPFSTSTGEGWQIIPILSRPALLVLAREQQNCVASYWNEIKAGRCYIYRVLVDQEVSTLSIVRTFQGKWTIGQLLTARNKPVSAQTRSVVYRWCQAINDGNPETSLSQPQSEQLLSPAPLPGGTFDALQINPIKSRSSLAELITDEPTVRQYLRRAGGNREHYYQAATGGESFLVSITPTRSGYRLKEVRCLNGGHTPGAVTAKLAEWLGRAQGKYR